MRRRLLSRKAAARWFRGYHPTRATLRENLLVARLKPLSADAAFELDEICGEHILDGEERTLFVVGTLLMRRGQRRLWRRVYRACQEYFKKGDEIRFLERMTVAARRGEL
jgi:hypothetical protein